MTEAKIHDRFLPFTEDELREHFAPVGARAQGGTGNHVARFLESARRFRELQEMQARGEAPTGVQLRKARQIEKDETFWTAACLVSFARHQDSASLFAEVLRRGFGEGPPVGESATWEELLVGDLKLYLEVGLPSPRCYQDWLRRHLGDRHFIPYVLEAAKKAGRLEGRTHLDAMLLAPETGFAVHFEAKATSDTDYQVSYDLLRNQIARNIDAMLDPNPRLAWPLTERRPDLSLFVLLTPSLFRDHAHSRLFGWLMNGYMSEPSTLGRDLPHRTGLDWQDLSRRLAWLTWEECEGVLPGSCPWLS